MIGFPQDISTTGHWIDSLFYLALGLTGVTFLIVGVLLVSFLILYRSRLGHKASYITGNSRRATVFTLSFAALVFLVIDVNLAIHDHFAWEAVRGSPPDPKSALRVQILAQQFAWNIRYAGEDGVFGTADDVVTVNQLYIPLDKPVLVQLRSKDVVHSFCMPNFRLKQDVIPGTTALSWFEAKKAGNYEIACAQLCGLAHYHMRGELVVEKTEDFQRWLVEQAKGPQQAENNWAWEWKGAVR